MPLVFHHHCQTRATLPLHAWVCGHMLVNQVQL